MFGFKAQNTSAQLWKERKWLVKLFGEEHHLIDLNTENAFIKPLKLLEDQVWHFVLDSVLGFIFGDTFLNFNNVSLLDFWCYLGGGGVHEFLVFCFIIEWILKLNDEDSFYLSIIFFFFFIIEWLKFKILDQSFGFN